MVAIEQCNMNAKELSIGWAMKQSDPVAAVQQVIDNVKAWSRRESRSFSALCGERFTRGEVVLMHCYLAGVFVVMCVAGWLEGGAV